MYIYAKNKTVTKYSTQMRRHVLLHFRHQKRQSKIIIKTVKFRPGTLRIEHLFDEITKILTLVLGIGVRPDEI